MSSVPLMRALAILWRSLYGDFFRHIGQLADFSSHLSEHLLQNLCVQPAGHVTGRQVIRLR